MSWIFGIPKHTKTWNDIVEHGVVYPHPESTKSELQDWIVQHAYLLQSMRDQWFKQQRQYDKYVIPDGETHERTST